MTANEPGDCVRFADSLLRSFHKPSRFECGHHQREWRGARAAMIGRWGRLRNPNAAGATDGSTGTWAGKSRNKKIFLDTISCVATLPVIPPQSRGALPGRWSSRGGVRRLRAWGRRCLAHSGRPGSPSGLTRKLCRRSSAGRGAVERGEIPRKPHPEARPRGAKSPRWSVERRSAAGRRCVGGRLRPLPKARLSALHLPLKGGFRQRSQADGAG
jgi:hypothetical protein